MNRGRRGFLLVFALLLVVLIAMLGLSLLNIQRAQHSSSQAALESLQARSLARAGMADAELKIAKDPFFPSGVGDNQDVFSYSEDVDTVRSATPVGRFTVTVDRSFEDLHGVVRIESTGIVGQNAGSSARYTIYGELSVYPDSYGFKVWRESVLPQL